MAAVVAALLMLADDKDASDGDDGDGDDNVEEEEKEEDVGCVAAAAAVMRGDLLSRGVSLQAVWWNAARAHIILTRLLLSDTGDTSSTAPVSALYSLGGGRYFRCAREHSSRDSSTGVRPDKVAGTIRELASTSIQAGGGTQPSLASPHMLHVSWPAVMWRMSG